MSAYTGKYMQYEFQGCEAYTDLFGIGGSWGSSASLKMKQKNSYHGNVIFVSANLGGRQVKIKCFGKKDKVSFPL